MAAKKSSKGRRYSLDEKRSVIDFVNQYNGENGRGGITAASNKFGVSTLTISAWLRTLPAGGRNGTRSVPGTYSGYADKRGRIIEELCKIDQEITAKRAEIKVLEARFEKLKTAL